MSKEDEAIWPGKQEQKEEFEAIQKERSERLRQKTREICTGPDESDCPTSPIMEQLQELSLKLDELDKALNDLGYRLAPVLKAPEPQTAGGESEQSEPKCSSDLGRVLSHDVSYIAEMRVLVSKILCRLEI